MAQTDRQRKILETMARALRDDYGLEFIGDLQSAEDNEYLLSSMGEIVVVMFPAEAPALQEIINEGYAVTWAFDERGFLHPVPEQE